MAERVWRVACSVGRELIGQGLGVAASTDLLVGDRDVKAVAEKKGIPLLEVVEQPNNRAYWQTASIAMQ